MLHSVKNIGISFLMLLSMSLYSVPSISYCVKSPSLIYAGETYTVNLTINKNEISGSSKFEVEVPEGFLIEPIITSGANFVFENNIGKFIWVILPNSESINLTYNIAVPKNYIGEEKIFRKFFFLTDKKIHEDYFYSVINIVKSDLLFGLSKESKISGKKANNIVFKIQLGAFLKEISPDILSEKINYKYKIDKEFINNYYKYFIGNYNSLEKAEEVKKSLGIKDVFIIAQKNGVKISIKEAIKINDVY